MRVETHRHRVGVALLLAGAWISFVAGCEEVKPPPKAPPGPRLYPVSGRVTVDGKRFARAMVVFLPSFDDAGMQSLGETDVDGRFTLTTFPERPGAARGDYRVIVSQIVGPNGKLADLASRSSDYVPIEFDQGTERVPKRYSDFSKTELRATIVRGQGHQTFNFDLTGPLSGPEPAAAPAGGEKPAAPSSPTGPAPAPAGGAAR